MCVYPHPDLALQEMKRVAKPDGRILLLENTLSTNPVLAKIQKVTSPLLAPFSRECKWDINVPELAKGAGLQLEQYKDVQQGTIMLGVYYK
jgi:ubiquinone/menaquinone biosynthesis C-methylase UbiE